ncbi:MAG TPA: serine hydrolase domain-containing protein, partial [Longimicrobiaceae bacterium]|nr:serine hydrolase domain-containing protein [Longimicrobiaceae bacterium]
MSRSPRVMLISLLELLLFSSAAPAAAQQSSDARFESVRAYIQEIMEESGLPSAAVAVARDGEIIWDEAFGYANLEEQIPATPETMYSLASISKPMTATALMQLVEDGRVELDQPANAYLGAGKIHSPEWDPSEATVERVLSHTAGLPLHWEFFYEGEDHPRRTTDEGIDRFGVLVTPPGALYQYSNLGFG